MLTKNRILQRSMVKSNYIAVLSLRQNQYNFIVKYRVRQMGCSLTHSARTPPAVHQGITIWVDEIEFEKK